MDKSLLREITDKLKENSYKYSLEGYITDGRYYVGEIFVYDCKNTEKIKKLFDRDDLKEARFVESYSWYLGDRRKAALIKLKEEVELTILEFESMQTENYVES